jgi:glucose/arabinose dehydrogenase
MRRTLALLAAAAATLVACGEDDPPSTSATPEAAQSGGDVQVDVVATGLEVPWDITFLPDGRALVTERAGRVRLVDAQGRLQEQPAATVDTEALGEGGLMGIDLDPDFARGQPFAYLYVTTSRGLQLQRWRVADNGTMTRDAVVLGGITAGEVHDSGRIRFGPDRNLYVLTGDAGQANLAQRGSSLNGKVLRLTPRQYRARTRRPTIVSRGHRNPQGLDWQPGSNRLWATEHGPSGGSEGPSGDDETNIVRRGRNYGWPRVRGRRHGRFTRPAFLWEQTVAPSGAAFVRRGAWRGDLLVATLAGEALHRLDVSGTRVRRDHVLLRGRFGRLRAVVAAPDGSFWVTTSNQDGRGDPAADDDRILRVRPPA